MNIDDTNEFPTPVEHNETEPQQDSKATTVVFTAVMVLSIITAIGLVIQAFATNEESIETEQVEVTTNEERVAAADIQLDDLVEDPTEEQLELMIESDFFSQSGLDAQVVERLNKQADKALKELQKSIPKVDLPKTEIDDLQERVEEAQDLLSDLETPDVENLSNIADKFRGSARGFSQSRIGKR